MYSFFIMMSVDNVVLITILYTYKKITYADAQVIFFEINLLD